jgi:ATPase family associated with various cellular activities (AAA)
MSERFKEHAWKACVGETQPWVRIPLSPPYLKNPAKAIGAEVHHVPSQAATVDNLKSTIDRCWYVPMAGNLGWHAVIIDEADRLTSSAMLAMYSVLDGTNCPPQTIFILTCNSVENFTDAFLGRCLRIPAFNTYGCSSSIKAKLAAIWKDRAGDAPLISLDKVPTSSVRAAYQWLEVELIAV